jgi:hypothetical protein
VPSGPGTEATVKYKLHYEDGSDAGTAEYAVFIQPGETIWTGDGRHLRVLDLVPTEDDSHEYTGLLRVEAV